MRGKPAFENSGAFCAAADRVKAVLPNSLHKQANGYQAAPWARNSFAIGFLVRRGFQTEMSMRRFELKLPDERLKALKALADRAGVSSAAVAKLAIDRMLEDRKRDGQSSEAA